MSFDDHENSHVAAIVDPKVRRMIAALRAARIGVFEFEPPTNTAYWDDRVRELWGISDIEHITYEIVVAQVHPDDRQLHDDETAKALDPDGTGQMDMVYRLFPKDGHPMRWVRAQATCHFENGRPVRLVGTVQDITEEQSSLERNKVLLNELEHRVKNTLATATAVVSLSRRGARDLDTYFFAVEDRLRNLGISNDALRQSDWCPVPFADLFARTAQAFLGPDWHQERIKLETTNFDIPAKDVMVTSMALHELMTNSAKYGALSNDTGAIKAGFARTGDNFVFSWHETGACQPTLTGKPSEGFGTLLLNTMFPKAFGGSAQMRVTDEGLHYDLTMPADQSSVL